MSDISNSWYHKLSAKTNPNSEILNHEFLDFTLKHRSSIDCICASYWGSQDFIYITSHQTSIIKEQHISRNLWVPLFFNHFYPYIFIFILFHWTLGITYHLLYQGEKSHKSFLVANIGPQTTPITSKHLIPIKFRLSKTRDVNN